MRSFARSSTTRICGRAVHPAALVRMRVLRGARHAFAPGVRSAAAAASSFRPWLGVPSAPIAPTPLQLPTASEAHGAPRTPGFEVTLRHELLDSLEVTWHRNKATCALLVGYKSRDSGDTARITKVISSSDLMRVLAQASASGNGTPAHMHTHGLKASDRSDLATITLANSQIERLFIWCTWNMTNCVASVTYDDEHKTNVTIRRKSFEAMVATLCDTLRAGASQPPT